MKCAELEPRIQQLQKEIETLTAEAAPKEVVDYTEKLTVLQYALEQYTNWDEGQDVPESVIEAFVAKIVVSKDGFDWYLRFDGDPDNPLHCQLQGKRKQTTKIMVAGDISPAVNNGTTGCYQGLRKDLAAKWLNNFTTCDLRVTGGFYTYQNPAGSGIHLLCNVTEM